MESGEKYLSSEELLLRLEKVDWKDVTLKLKAYSLLRIKQHSKIVTDELIKIAVDMANDAIGQLWTEERKWNINYYPDVYSFLKGAVDSLRSNFYKKISKAKNVGLSEETMKDESSFESNFIALDLKDKIMKSFKDDALAALVFEAIADGGKPREISDDLGENIKEVYNAVKRVNRKINEIKHSLD